MNRLRSVFFGSGSPVSVETFEALLRVTRVLRCVIPDHLSRRNELVSRARGASVEIIRVNRTALSELGRLLDCDVAVIGTFPWILPEAILDIPRLGFFNIHMSVLPRHRGDAPLVRAYLTDDAETGVTIHRVEREVDAGPIVLQRKMDLERGRYFLEIYSDLSRIAAAMVVDLVDALQRDEVTFRAQDSGDEPENPEPELPIDWSEWTAERVWHVLRGLGGFRPDLIEIEGERFVIDRVDDPRIFEHGQESGTATVEGRRAELYAVDGAVTVRMAAKFPMALARVLRAIRRIIRR